MSSSIIDLKDVCEHQKKVSKCKLCCVDKLCIHQNWPNRCRRCKKSGFDKEKFIKLCERCQEIAYNYNFNSKYEMYPMWALHETISLVHHYLAVEVDYDNFLSMAKGLYEMMEDIDLVEFNELKDGLRGI